MANKKTPLNKKRELPKNAVTKAKMKIVSKKDDLVLPKIPIKGIAKKIAETGVPSELLEVHLNNILHPEKIKSKPRREIAVRMLFCLADGWSIKEAALLCGISDMTIYQFWGNPKSEYYDEAFSQIISLGIHFSELWWTSVGRSNLTNKVRFDSTLWMMNMSNRFGWTRKLDGKIIEKWNHIVSDEKKEYAKKISSKTIVAAYEVLNEIGITDSSECDEDAI